MQILGFLGMYFDAVGVEFKTFLLLFRLALAILCYPLNNGLKQKECSYLIIVLITGYLE
jgi:hypothetical protein